MITRVGGGGLEHKNSTRADGQPLGDADAARATSAGSSWPATSIFHAWNVKRLRPVELGPVRLRERDLHAQPVDRRRRHRLLRRPAGAPRRALDARRIPRRAVEHRSRSCRRRPGRLVQSAEMASFDAWIKYYRPDENSTNTSISYYTKGAVIGVPARRADPQGDQRRQEPRRRDARGVSEVLGRAGLHARRVPRRGRAGGRREPEGVLGRGRRRHRGARLRRGARHVRPAVPAGRSARPSGPAGRGSASTRATTTAVWS